MKIVSVVAFLVVLAASSWWLIEEQPSPHGLAETSVKVAVSLTPLSTPFFIAQEQGFFAKHGLDVEIMPCKGGVKCAHLLQEDKVDYATASETVALFNRYHHSNVSILSSFVRSSNDLKLLALEANNISKLSDLAGKKVGIVKSSSSEFYFDLLLITHALQDLQVERVYIQPDELVAALLSYQVDAISIWEPYGYRATLVSASPLINLGTEGVYQLSFNLLSKSVRGGDRKEQDRLLLLALSDAIEWIEANPDDSIDLISQELGILPQQVNWAWNDYVFELTNDYSLLSNLQLQARWASERNILEGDPVDVRALVDYQLLGTVD
ncbi:ABC transporter substrate-binding protein [Vibrio caribbeanicus]|uniref:ABC transporter substrate-binding protein n=1 Tax=Vibrio caribbeanicus TaxID=701175 RepID=A0ACC4NS48_9VIBR|nr:ABC transporter substrate-binding protein [Vibrio caribbeanicus]KHD23319.1 ABC transporter substrate-binding protein [Vibrio caribbeanicus]